MRLTVVGRDDLGHRWELDELRADLGLDDVTFVEEVDRAGVVEHLHASDCALLPSRFEPCGLTQLYALRFGALPLVRRTGGLADTVVDANAVTLAEGSATGFVFDEETPEALLEATGRAVALYADRASWQRVMQQAMSCDFSWGAAAHQYKTLYTRLTASAAAAQQRRLA